jgi:hypothetical protein
MGRSSTGSKKREGKGDEGERKRRLNIDVETNEFVAAKKKSSKQKRHKDRDDDDDEQRRHRKGSGPKHDKREKKHKKEHHQTTNLGHAPDQPLDDDKDYFAFHKHFWLYLYSEEKVAFNDLTAEESRLRGLLQSTMLERSERPIIKNNYHRMQSARQRDTSGRFKQMK